MSNTKRTSTGKSSDKSSKSQELPKSHRQIMEIEILVDGVSVDVFPELVAAVKRALNVHESLPKEMTTTQAAEFLDVSRPFVVKLVKQGELPCRMVGTHRRIPSAALAKYKEKMFQQAKSAADEMAQLSQKMGLYEDTESTPKAK